MNHTTKDAAGFELSAEELRELEERARAADRGEVEAAEAVLARLRAKSASTDR